MNLKKAQIVEAIENEIVTEENFKSLETFFENIQCVSKLFNNFKKIKKKEQSITKKDIADLLGIKTNQMTSILSNEFLKNDTGCAYFLTQ